MGVKILMGRGRSSQEIMWKEVDDAAYLCTFRAEYRPVARVF